MGFTTRLICFALFAAGLWAQSIDLYSEFRRVDPYGKIVTADRAGQPREILSPAVARGAHASFHVAVSVPPGEDYFLYVASNPEDACTIKLYKERFAKAGAEWVPDEFEEVRNLPAFGTMPDAAENIQGQTTRVYLLDIAVPQDAKPGRFRVEAQLKTGSWIVRPLEVRVFSPQIPAVRAVGGVAPRVPAPGEGSDAAVSELLGAYFAGKFSPAQIEPRTVREVILRDVIQDLVLAGPFDAANPRTAALRRLWEGRKPRKETGPEWYLTLRDYLYSTEPR